TDHMFVMDYNEQNGWHNAQILPYANISLDPASMILHYGQEVFEGMKAYRGEDNKIMLFRPEKNFERLNISNDRLCIPKLDEDFCLKALTTLIEIDKDWVPHDKGTSLYIRPFVIATQSGLGVHPAKEYKFIIICCPVGSYYKEGLNPVKIYVESEYVRAVKGGTGFIKSGGNYAASLKGQEKAEKLNYSQVLWLDGKEHKYIEEVGAMNVFFKINGIVVTPSLEGSILPGITRRSVIEVLKDWGVKVEERKISIDELVTAYENGMLEEAFGSGTAAVISPIGEFNYQGKIMIVNNNKIGNLSQKLYDYITDIQWGRIEDKYGWVKHLNF
ncbi:MAG: branched-chain amino acid aminotransferase, partial [Clostridia bacterium]|nr:branched-chain amino acid aminotransferase [Clostridia bacterium]